MYGLIGRIKTQSGKRQELIAVLLEASRIIGRLPACRQYLVTEDLADETVVHVFEAWDDKRDHDDSLRDEQVRSLIARAMPLMDGAPSSSELNVAGGHGIPA